MISAFIKKHAKRLVKLTLAAIMVIPFFLYYAALNDINALIYVLLGAMGAVMLLVLKVG